LLELKRSLDSWAASFPPAEPSQAPPRAKRAQLDERDEEHLRALGYLDDP
jgi:hypothetical protein